MPTAPPGKVADEGASAGPPASGDAVRGVKANVGSGVAVEPGREVPVALRVTLPALAVKDELPVALAEGLPLPVLVTLEDCVAEEVYVGVTEPVVVAVVLPVVVVVAVAVAVAVAEAVAVELSVEAEVGDFGRARRRLGCCSCGKGMPPC
jgi:hypothetical protein